MLSQYEHAGSLGELVVQADRASVAQDMGGNPAHAMAALKHALQRKLLDGLRYLLKSELSQQLAIELPQHSNPYLSKSERVYALPVALALRTARSDSAMF